MDPPKVTGLSPKEGEPGTKVVLRGENLGVSQRDLLSLTICGIECLMYAEWHSPSKIVARCGAARVAQFGDVIVTTKSGGKGTCTVQFKVLVRCIGLTDESAVWVDESWFGKNRPTSPSQLYPDDPLRLSDESSVERFPVDDLQEIFPEGSGNILSHNFEPTWYLLENHHGARFDDLKTGLAFLRRKVETHDEGPLAFMKSNVSSVMSCLDALDNLKSGLEKDVQALGNNLAVPADQAIQKAKEEAFDLFEEMLSRKEKADSTRNALSVLQRFRFLFNLPANIEKNIRKGDYEMVINDYARAKSLFHDTEVAVFKKVYSEVEQRIEHFRAMLLEKLKDQPSTVEEQKRLVKFLVNLETPNDPAWQCVIHTKMWLLNVLNELKDTHITLASSHEKREAGNSLSQLDMPQLVKFIVEITERFSEHFPNLWKLGQAYLGGQLHIRENSDASDKVGLPKNIQFKNMVLEVSQKVCCLIRMGILPDSLHALSVQQLQALGSWPKTENLTPWLPHCLRCIRNCYSALLKLEMPDDMLNSIQMLIFDLKVHAMKTLFQQASHDIQHLNERETWIVEIDDTNGGTTQLPLLFENRVVETLQLVRENVLQHGPKENDIFLQLNVQGAVKQSSQSMLQAFAISLEKMVQEIKSKDDRSRLLLQRSFNQNMFMDEDNEVPSDDAKCLIILSNCTYTVKNIIPRLQDSFIKYGYPDMQLVIKSSIARFQEVISKLFEAYVERKADPIVGAIEPRMYASCFSWESDYKPTGVSIYIKQTILDMSEIHAEVFSVSPPFVSKVLTKVVEGVVEELARLYECAESFQGNGNIQATLNIRALEDVMSAYKTNSTNKYFMSCRGKLKPFPNPKDAELVNDLLRTFKNQIWLQLLCFKENLVSV
ncbi:exocyst complex component 2 isoform X1 [Parasteatoda tepidariorum]|uniref:exocyst complex component 2 isoform X1 n=1 Tax=Parasteatoda tepidariorum TaxID=114398 RepID=UPI001C718F91|nr:exocyst complex component 2 isoform X1 [Parasteatoda tepidariorum]XP_042900896.1 exocyst complex component 2 isoform X1 [Parasteatoda tepidariorum]XP_042900897.1 exocyst complex component 2 isoform X1 [Parasteatoda tepidariorum]